MAGYQNYVSVCNTLIGGTALNEKDEVIYLLMVVTAIHAEKGLMVWFFGHNKDGRIEKYMREEIKLI